MTRSWSQPDEHDFLSRLSQHATPSVSCNLCSGAGTSAVCHAAGRVCIGARGYVISPRATSSVLIPHELTRIGLTSCSRLASPCGETNVTRGDSRERFDHELFLSCPYAAFEIVDGVIPENRNFALTHDQAAIVLGINEMNRNARFCLAGLKHRLEYVIPVHPTPTESR